MAKIKDWIWLTRDEAGDYYDVHLQKRPIPRTSIDGYNGDACFCSSLFEETTRFHLKPGEKAKVEITVRRKK